MGFRKVKFGIAAGMTMYLNRRYLLRLELGLYELSIAKYFKSLTSGIYTGYDLGSAHGYYTLAFCKQGAQIVYSFEINSSYVIALEETLQKNKINDNIRVFEYCIRDHSDGKQRSIDDLIMSGEIM